jgi:hypothetical protein
MQVLLSGEFHSTLETIGEHFKLDTLAIQSVGFLAVSHAVHEGIHHDFENVQGKAFNFLTPVLLPSSSSTEPELKIVGSNATMDEITTFCKCNTILQPWWEILHGMVLGIVTILPRKK